MKLSRAMLFDVLIAACIYLWQIKGIGGARIFMEAYLWFVVAMHLIFILLAGKKDLYYRPPISVAYDVVSTLVLTGVLIWIGMVMLPITLFICWILTSAKLEGFKKSEVA